jgi:hypothetical protein
MIGRIIKIGDLDPASIAEAIAGKQDALIFDSAPTLGSENPVTSDGVARALQDTQYQLSFDDSPREGSRNPVTSAGIKAAIDGKQDALIFDGTPVSGSTHPVTSGGVHAALGQKQNRLYFDSEPTRGSNNVLTSGSVYDALKNMDITVAMDDVPTENSDHVVSSGGIFLALTGKQDKIWRTTVSLTSAWTGSDPYAQVITIPNTTEYSMVELQPSIAAIRSFKQAGVDAMWVENDNGVLTVYALGAAPSSAMELQCVIMEVGNSGSASVEPALPIDDALSRTSRNPVQNRVIYDALQDKENIDNKVTTISAISTDNDYPSAKAVWELFSSIVDGDSRNY